jgi:hypothetical protein
VQLGGMQIVQEAANQWESFKTTHCLFGFFICICFNLKINKNHSFIFQPETMRVAQRNMIDLRSTQKIINS